MSLNARFYSLEVAEIRRETPDAVSIRFAVPAALTETFKFEAGQHLTLRAEIGGQDVRRTYSLCAAPSEGVWRIAVKRMPGGMFSRWANEEIVCGQAIDVLPPMGRFVEPENGHTAPRYVALAGGSGITPILSILKNVLETHAGSRFALFYGNRDTRSIMFLEELAGLKNRYLDRLEVYHVLEDEVEDIALFNGRLDREKCGEIFSGLVDVARTDCFFVCGPGPMMDEVEAALRARNVPPERIRIERFTDSQLDAGQRARSEALHKAAAGTQLSVILDGRTTRVEFDPAKSSILDCVQAAGLPAPYACRGGVCTTCRAKVVRGSVTMMKNYGLTADEVARGYVLTCQSVPASREVVLSYDD